MQQAPSLQLSIKGSSACFSAATKEEVPAPPSMHPRSQSARSRFGSTTPNASPTGSGQPPARQLRSNFLSLPCTPRSSPTRRHSRSHLQVHLRLPKCPLCGSAACANQECMPLTALPTQPMPQPPRIKRPELYDQILMHGGSPGAGADAMPPSSSSSAMQRLIQTTRSTHHGVGSRSLNVGQGGHLLEPAAETRTAYFSPRHLEQLLHGEDSVTSTGSSFRQSRPAALEVVDSCRSTGRSAWSPTRGWVGHCASSPALGAGSGRSPGAAAAAAAAAGQELLATCDSPKLPSWAAAGSSRRSGAESSMPAPEWAGGSPGNSPGASPTRHCITSPYTGPPSAHAGPSSPIGPEPRPSLMLGGRSCGSSSLTQPSSSRLLGLKPEYVQVQHSSGQAAALTLAQVGELGAPWEGDRPGPVPAAEDVAVYRAVTRAAAPRQRPSSHRLYLHRPYISRTLSQLGSAAGSSTLVSAAALLEEEEEALDGCSQAPEPWSEGSTEDLLDPSPHPEAALAEDGRALHEQSLPAEEWESSYDSSGPSPMLASRPASVPSLGGGVQEAPTAAPRRKGHVQFMRAMWRSVAVAQGEQREGLVQARKGESAEPRHGRAHAQRPSSTCSPACVGALLAAPECAMRQTSGKTGKKVR